MYNFTKIIEDPDYDLQGLLDEDSAGQAAFDYIVKTLVADPKDNE